MSLIVPARDEERDLSRAVRSRLEDDYPDLQVVIVDDRSEDRTGQIADEIARADPKRCVLIDATAELTAVQETIRAAVRARLGVAI